MAIVQTWIVKAYNQVCEWTHALYMKLLECDWFIMVLEKVEEWWNTFITKYGMKIINNQSSIINHQSLFSFSFISRCEEYWNTYLAPYTDPVWKKIGPTVMSIYNDLRKAARMWWKALKSRDMKKIQKGK